VATIEGADLILLVHGNSWRGLYVFALVRRTHEKTIQHFRIFLKLLDEVLAVLVTEFERARERVFDCFYRTDSGFFLSKK
jgi:hypothetical protein